MFSNCDLLSLNRTEIADILAQNGQPAYRAGQLFSWLHAKNVFSPAGMTNLPKAVTSGIELHMPTVAARQVSSDRTIKYLYRFADGNSVETVAMFYEHGMSICVSTQAGCRMGCAFCASTKNGLARSLTAGEMLAQVYLTALDQGQRADSIVLMGSGEPLDNFDNVLRFYELVTCKEGYALANRSVSLSTCGVVPKMYKLADRRLPLTLSVSLHAAFDDKRSELMPINRAYPIKELMAACRYYSEKCGRRISFEYAVIDGANNTRRDAEQLVRLLSGFPAHVNLIPINSGGGFAAQGRAAAKAFCELLVSLGLTATVRRTLGADIDAACGQLRSRYIE